MIELSLCIIALSCIHTAGQPPRQGTIMAGLYAVPDRVFLPIVNPDDEIALEDNMTIEYSLEPLPEFQSNIEFGAVIGNEQTFQATNLIIIDDDSETKYTSLLLTRGIYRGSLALDYHQRSGGSVINACVSNNWKVLCFSHNVMNS